MDLSLPGTLFGRFQISTHSDTPPLGTVLDHYAGIVAASWRAARTLKCTLSSHDQPIKEEKNGDPVGGRVADRGLKSLR